MHQDKTRGVFVCWLETVKDRQSSSAADANGYLVCLDKIRRASDEMWVCTGTVLQACLTAEAAALCCRTGLYWAGGFGDLADCPVLYSSIYN